MEVVTGDQLREAREGLGATQTEVAELAGVFRSDVCAFENGREFFGDQRLARINAALGKLQAEQLQAKQDAAEAEFLARVGGVVIARVKEFLNEHQRQVGAEH